MFEKWIISKREVDDNDDADADADVAVSVAPKCTFSFWDQFNKALLL